MTSQRRTFTDEQRLEILQEAEKMGVTAVLRNHSLSYSVFAKWKQKFMKPDINLGGKRWGGKTKSEIKMLTEENMRLRKIIADLALDLQQRNEELKKSYSFLGKR